MTALPCLPLFHSMGKLCKILMIDAGVETTRPAWTRGCTPASELDDENSLHITDRRKVLIKTSGGHGPTIPLAPATPVTADGRRRTGTKPRSAVVGPLPLEPGSFTGRMQ